MCEAGKIVNIVGKERLIYSNKVHQRLKRMFKIYNYLFNELLRMLRKKPSLQLRVPYCTLIEYRGYTALVSYLPEMRACDKERVGKPLKMLLAGLDEDRFEVREIFNRSPCLYMVTCK